MLQKRISQMCVTSFILLSFDQCCIDTQLATNFYNNFTTHKPCQGEGTVNFSNNDSQTKSLNIPQELKTLLLDKGQGDPYSFTPLPT